MQGYSLTDINLQPADEVTLNVDQERRELIVENIEARQVNSFCHEMLIGAIDIIYKPYKNIILLNIFRVGFILESTRPIYWKSTYVLRRRAEIYHTTFTVNTAPN